MFVSLGNSYNSFTHCMCTVAQVLIVKTKLLILLTRDLVDVTYMLRLPTGRWHIGQSTKKWKPGWGTASFIYRCRIHFSPVATSPVSNKYTACQLQCISKQLSMFSLRRQVLCFSAEVPGTDIIIWACWNNGELFSGDLSILKSHIAIWKTCYSWTFAFIVFMDTVNLMDPYENNHMKDMVKFNFSCC